MKRILVVLALLAVAVGAFAASANITHVINLQVIEVVAVGLNDASAITLTTVAPVVPGDPPTGQSDNSKLVILPADLPAAIEEIVRATLLLADIGRPLRKSPPRRRSDR